MKIIILGGDGYLGWPTAMHFAAQGHDVWAVDNYLRRRISDETQSQPLFETPDLKARAELFKAHTGKDIQVIEGDCCDFDFMGNLFQTIRPDAVVHYAEQPSAPYSMRGYDEARLTLDNNLQATFNVIWAAIQFAPECHIIKLGTMGEYGTPNIDIEEGWININHNGRQDKFLFPRQAGSLYHTTKVLDTDLLWFYVRTHNLRVTDLMQGPVYGFLTAESRLDEKLRPHFNYDDIFGTVLNRFMVQAVAATPLTVYGKGGQTRGYLNMIDTMQCVDLASRTPPKQGELRILNQFVEQFSVNQLAARVKNVGDAMGLNVSINAIPNPRKEAEDHYYNAKNTGFHELGLKPNPLTDDVLAEMLQEIIAYKDRIDKDKIMPRVRWNNKAA